MLCNNIIIFKLVNFKQDILLQLHNTTYIPILQILLILILLKLIIQIIDLKSLTFNIDLTLLHAINYSTSP